MNAVTMECRDYVEAQVAVFAAIYRPRHACSQYGHKSLTAEMRL
jgi:hypothetical protein